MKNQREHREEIAAYITMVLVGIVSLVLIGVTIQTIFNLF